jgi:hypothetical protein
MALPGVGASILIAYSGIFKDVSVPVEPCQTLLWPRECDKTVRSSGVKCSCSIPNQDDKTGRKPP